ncbi:hypothetical protein SLAV_04920 [Streptomyces lavendulae subsp. lavendulae]|uniref:Uncharacterized protein n=1 Tax=Streptomyces lavendulae subsp. lavendulae TaxID=58340 RepID=A0A2K8P9W1_STRLA|nr:hypothetical protein [Streptomyces lavendulae]ATZ22890.1 hypothetical protein SLAV_04920 [Streptomyces lavendulae subsp. lavendulae]QUQ52732.1 hypothetical protein SLLC_02960 [Streptomyces lavendulae subsp. lavendulae]
MSEFYPPSEPSEQSGQSAPEAGSGGRKRLARVLPRGRGGRWAAAGVAAAVIVGGGAAAVAVAGHHHERVGKGPRFEWAEGGHEGGHGHGREGGPGHAHEGKGERMAHRQGAPEIRDGADALAGAPKGTRKGSQKTAPAPLPSLPIGQAAEKAAGAVSGGKVESLRPVAQEGGGSAWLAVVLGPDGVRHAVTVSGSDGTVSGNVTLNGRQAQ